MKMIIIADDLTGALDSAVAFAARGFRTICALSPDHLDEAINQTPDVLAVSTGSRERTPDEARILSTQVSVILARHPIAKRALRLKKIDSRLKGHVAIEVSALRRTDEPVVLCPAIPDMGRIVLDGALQGAGVATPIPVGATVNIAGAQVLEATRQADLDSQVAAYKGNALFVGAAGLAIALARRLAGNAPPMACPALPGPAVFAIGSRDPITLAQLEGLAPLPAPNGILPETLSISPARDPDILQMVAGPDNVENHVADMAFAETVANRVRQSGPNLLLASGGQTAGAILYCLSCGLLEVLGEALPGLPVSRALDGPRGLVVVTKSGGFGAPDTLVKLTQSLVRMDSGETGKGAQGGR